MAGGVSCPYAVVRVVAGDDGVVPGCPGGGVAVEVVADDDGVVPGRSGGGVTVGVAADDDGVVPRRSGGGIADGGAFEDPAKRWDVGMSLMESVAWRPQWTS